MIRCPACRAEFDYDAQSGGKCPRCGTQVQQAAKRTVGDLSGSSASDSSSGSSLELELVGDQHTPERDPENVLDDSMSTIELPSTGNMGPRKPATIENVGDRTIDIPAPGTSGQRRTRVGRGDQTVDFGSDDDLVRRLSVSWTGTHADDTPQRATIKQNDSRVGYRSTLPVKSRSLRPRDASGSTSGRPADAPDYELLDLIGEGGMGVVYAAHQSSIARTVAVKMLKAGTNVSDEHRDKFISEAVVTGELDHPNIVPIYDLGANDQGALFYSMKKVKGTPWEDVLKQKDLDDNLNILLRVADAVAFAHASGVVHRDLKPENVMLGDFGEVLVMDWGLARVTDEFPSSGSIYQTNTLGGTPAYMAPEMARGPIEDIDHRSDIYLLGAMLYEIIGGRAPHVGRDVMQCLMAAAQNRIEPVDYTGELLEIALKAMATDRDQRYQSVKDFQQAIREYQSHSESVVLAGQAQRHFTEAQATGDYQLYARAMYGFQEALDLWSGNTRAREKLLQAELAYARTALAADDLDLAESLLSVDRAEHAELLSEVRAAQQVRRDRRRMLQRMRYLVAGLGVALLALGLSSYVAIRSQYTEAVTQRDRADANAKIAKQNETEALAAKQLAERAKIEEENQKIEALRQEQLARDAEAEAKRQEQAARDSAEAARVAEGKARDSEQLALDAKAAEEYESYVAKIGLAAAKVDENAYGFADELLDDCPPERRNWEWGRLKYLVELAGNKVDCRGAIASVAWSPDARQFASADWSGRLVVRDAESRRELFAVTGGQFMQAVAYAPNATLIAAADSDGVAHIVSAADGTVVRSIEAHDKGVLSVAFSPEGDLLVTTSYDNTARIWNVDTGALVQELVGHNWWVWSADFDATGQRLLTASQDGRVIVWQQSTSGVWAIQGQFTGHQGPVYCARFSPTGTLVASGGYDGQVCLWKPDELSATQLALQVEQSTSTAQKFRSLQRHEAAVRSVAFDATGERLLSGGHDNVVWLWDVAAGEPIKVLRGHASRVEAVAFSPDGRQALSGGQDRQLRQWNVADYEESRIMRGRVLDGHLDAVLAAEFMPDGQGVVTASRDRTAQLYDTATGQLVRRFDEGHQFLATSCVFFDDGRRMATGAGDNSVRLWDVQTGGQLVELRPTGRTGTLAVAPGGAWIVTGGASNTAQIWDSTTGESIATLAAHQSEVTATAVSGDASLIATGDERGDIVVWKVAAGGQAAEPIAQFAGHSRTITALEFSPNGQTLISSSGDRTCGQWDLASGRELTDRVLKHPDYVASVDVSADGTLAVTTCDDGVVRVWSLADARVVAETRLDNQVVNAARFAPDSSRVLITSWEAGRVWQWNPQTDGELLTTLEPTVDFDKIGGLLWSAEYTPDGQRIVTIGGNDARLWSLDAGDPRTVLRFSPHGAVAAVAVSPDGQWLATGSWDTTAKLWDVATGRVVRKLVGGHTGYVNSVAFSPDGNWLATAGDDGVVRVWNVATGEMAQLETMTHAGAIRAVSYSPDGTLLLTASADGTAALWGANNGQRVRQLAGHKFGLLDARFSRDGVLVATGGEDNVAIVWTTATGQPVGAPLTGHTSSVTSVAFSGDGSRLLTASQDNTAKLWDTSTGKEVLTLHGHTRELTSVGFSPDGQTALTASRDGTAILWPAAEWSAEPVAGN
jgi:WD40 repeat protein